MSKARAKVLALAKDASDLAVMDEIVERTLSTFGGIDIVVNNAVHRVFKPFEEVEPDEFRRSLEVNITGYFFLIQKVLPHMAGRGGSIINLSSIFGFVGSALLSTYCVTKGAVANMTRTLALELAEKNVRVNAVAPGPIDTKGLRALLTDPAVLEDRLSGVPLHRLGTPEEVAEACLFLASDASSYVNGHNLVTDGGFLAH
ncbi:MAG: SDR family NAD(P)-dependent oxidoreductase [Nitrospinota bacterium]